jgi:hypothetical protein
MICDKLTISMDFYFSLRRHARHALRAQRLDRLI